ncbi:MAG: hypothetical protein HZB38_18805 [Planctomycetes bacterium]|nr:hypothetical protein [Planctomycetota bacterium]
MHSERRHATEVRWFPAFANNGDLPQRPLSRAQARGDAAQADLLFFDASRIGDFEFPQHRERAEGRILDAPLVQHFPAIKEDRRRFIVDGRRVRQGDAEPVIAQHRRKQNRRFVAELPIIDIVQNQHTSVTPVPFELLSRVVDLFSDAREWAEAYSPLRERFTHVEVFDLAIQNMLVDFDAIIGLL